MRLLGAAERGGGQSSSEWRRPHALGQAAQHHLDPPSADRLRAFQQLCRLLTRRATPGPMWGLAREQFAGGEHPGHAAPQNSAPRGRAIQ